MANWITLKNGVHIDLDDPNNPVTGNGKFSDLGNKQFSFKDAMARREKLAQVIVSSKNREEVKQAISEMNSINRMLQDKGYARNVNGAFVVSEEPFINDTIKLGNNKEIKVGDDVHISVNGQREWMTIDKINNDTVVMHGYHHPLQKMTRTEFELYAKKGFIYKK